MRTVMANGCLQLHRTTPCDAVSTRSRPSETLIGTIRGLFNYIWADNKDPGQINGRKAAGFHRRLVTLMSTSPVLRSALWLPRDILRQGKCWRMSRQDMSLKICLQAPPNKACRTGWRSLSYQGSTVHGGDCSKHWKQCTFGRSQTFLFIKNMSSSVLLPRSALVKLMLIR